MDTIASHPRTASEFVARQLRARILGGGLPAGAHLRQNHIAAEFGVSSTPVREALRELAAEGLVVSDAHRGTMVRGLTLPDVRDIYELRLVLEPILIRRSFPLVTEDGLTEAESLIARMAATADMTEWSQMNRDFHAIFWQSHRETRLFRMAESLQDAAMPYVAMSLYGRGDEIARSDTDHRAILAAYRRQDCEGAVSLNQRHLEATIDIIREKLTEAEG